MQGLSRYLPSVTVLVLKKEIRRHDPIQADSQPKYYCEWPGCGKACGRPFDLLRHRNTIHGTTVKFACTALGCHHKDKRPDGLKIHVKRMHDSNTLFSCPEKDCKAEPMKPSLLRVHVARHQTTTRKYFNSLLPVVCPFPKCRDNRFIFSGENCYDGFHLTKHKEADRLANSEAIFQAGYDAKSCRIVCPICHQLFGPSEWWEFRGIRTNPWFLRHLKKHDKQQIIQYEGELLDLVPRWYHEVLELPWEEKQ